LSIIILRLASLSRAVLPSNDATLGLPAVAPASLDPGALIPFTDVVIQIRECPIDTVVSPQPEIRRYAATWAIGGHPVLLIWYLVVGRDTPLYKIIRDR
jgi:hypothetical protein